MTDLDPDLDPDLTPGLDPAPGSGAEGDASSGDSAPSAGEAPSLEDRLRRLDRIVAHLEGGEVELEAGLALFEEGVRHIREAEALLAQAELRVEELVGGEGDTRTRGFTGEGAAGGGSNAGANPGGRR